MVKRDEHHPVRDGTFLASFDIPVYDLRIDNKRAVGVVVCVRESGGVRKTKG